jgi:Methylamine utilisation protein MauE
MVETITPVVHGGSRSRWGAAVLLHAIAASLTAGGFGAMLGATGHLLGAPWGSGGAIVVAGVAVWALAHEALGVRFPVPQLRRQVPEWWRTFFSPFASAALYGGALGIGFFTYLLHATLVVVSTAAFASGRPLVGAAVMAPFGLARGLASAASIRGPEIVHALADFAHGGRRLAPLHVGALAAVALSFATAARGDVAIRPLALALVAVVFAWSAAWKIVRVNAWRDVLAGYGLGRVGPAVAVLVPAAEVGVVLAAAAGARRPAGTLALALLVAFTAAAIRRRSGAGRVPCGCFGASETSVPALLVRNAALAIAATIAVSAGRPLDLRLPAEDDVVPLLLSLGGAIGLVLAARSVVRSLSGGRA